MLQERDLYLEQDYEQLTLFQGETHVNRIVLQTEIEKEKRTKDFYGLNTCELSKNSDRIGCLTKMLLEVYPTELFLKKLTIWSKKAITVSCYLYQLLPSVRGILGKELLSLPTPTASDCKGGRSPETSQRVGRTERNNLRDYIRHIHATPTASQNHKKIRCLTPSEENGTHGKILPGSLGEHYPETIGRYPNPQFLEWMQGFPIGWTELKH